MGNLTEISNRIELNASSRSSAQKIFFTSTIFDVQEQWTIIVNYPPQNGMKRYTIQFCRLASVAIVGCISYYWIFRVRDSRLLSDA